MAGYLCPYLGSGDEAGQRGPAQTYPSFENRCFALEHLPPGQDELESGSTLLLRDQATYCLGETHTLCPRFQALEGAPEGLPEPDPFAPLGDEEGYWDAPPPTRGLGFWLGLGTMLAVFLFCGGSVAAYMGWQWIGRNLAPGAQSTAVQTAVQPTPGPVLLLVQTATPVAPTPIPATPTPTPSPTAGPGEISPGAEASRAPVTRGDQAQSPGGPLVITTPTPTTPPVEPAAPALATAVAGPVIITTPGARPPVPTRGPPPAASRSPGGQTTVIVVTATPTPDLPEPTVEFRAAHQSLPPNACTILSWDVENARAVFLDAEGVAGHGERRVCLGQESQTYELSVLSLDGVESLHQVTVELRPYTPTPTITPTPTPVFTPTPTWTPEGGAPAGTATPTIAVSLIVDGGNQRTCTPGQECEAVLQVRNESALADEIFVNLGKEGPWNARICRSDGICGETVVSLGVGPGQQVTLFVRVDAPPDAAGQSYTYRVEAVSGNSGHTVSSGPGFVTFRVN